jgi:adenine deaminase
MSARLAPLVAVGLLIGAPGACRPPVDHSRADLYHGFVLIDPAREALVSDAYVVVTDGRITEVGDGRPPRGEFRARRDMTGRWGLPGFVDAHAHITSGPHTVEVIDGAPVVRSRASMTSPSSAGAWRWRSA